MYIFPDSCYYVDVKTVACMKTNISLNVKFVNTAKNKLL